MLTPFHYGTYATQDVAAEVFGVGQATVSRSIGQIAPVVRQCIQMPARIHDRAKRASTIEDLEEILPGLRCLTDASEQQVQGPKQKDMGKSHYSGKAGRHTAGVQYTVNANGLIVHNTRHSPGRVHYAMVQDGASDVSIRPAVPGRVWLQEGWGRGSVDRGCPGRRRCTKGWKCWHRSGKNPENLPALESPTGCTQRFASTCNMPSEGSGSGR